jgi:predicted metal-binding protein
MDEKGHIKEKVEGSPPNGRTAGAEFDRLVKMAHELGASEVGVVAASRVPVDDALANLCGETPCYAYGLSRNCPPHVSGPKGFRELTHKTRYALVFRIDIPELVMFSNDRNEVFGLVQESVSKLERAAVRMGYTKSKGFAGGSCKNTFCSDLAACRVLSEQGECRNPERARPSMSGFGINVGELLRRAGISPKNGSDQAHHQTESMTWVAGLVMLG